jgi:hypothetical protein
VVSLSRDRQRPYRKQLHDLRRWQRYEHHNLSFSYGALLSALLSCLLLAGRSLMQWNGLIVGALALFGVGVLCLLCVVWRWLWWSLHHPSAAWVPVQDKRSSSLRRVPRVRRAIAPSRSTLQLVGRSPRS